MRAYENFGGNGRGFWVVCILHFFPYPCFPLSLSLSLLGNVEKPFLVKILGEFLAWTFFFLKNSFAIGEPSFPVATAGPKEYKYNSRERKKFR